MKTEKTGEGTSVVTTTTSEKSVETDKTTTETKVLDYGAAKALAQIKASNESYCGVSDFSTLTFDDFSNTTSDPIYLRVSADESADGVAASMAVKNSDTLSDSSRYFLKNSHTWATHNGSTVAFWSTKNYGLNSGQLRLYFNAKSETDKSVKQFFFNNGVVKSLPMEGTVDLKEVKDFVAVKASDLGTVTAVIENTKKKNITAVTAVAVLADSNGKILASSQIDNRENATIASTTLTAPVEAGEVVFLTYSHNGATDGTIKVKSIVFEAGGSDSNTSTAYIGSYKGTLTGHNETVYPLTINGPLTEVRIE